MSYRDLVNRLIESNISISTMESCTGGGVSNAITNIEGASEVIKFSGECADEMSFNISKFSNSDLGVGVTGKLNRSDPNNPRGDDNTVFITPIIPNCMNCIIKFLNFNFFPF